MDHVDHDGGSDKDFLREDDADNRILTYAPEDRFRLGYLDVMCLVVNRMIGTGIFMTPGKLMDKTHSTGASLLFWAAGIIYALAGTHVYIEYGLNVPRYVFEGIEQGIPRSGGDLNYLQYVFKKPAYRKNTVLFSTCLFGVAFIALGNMAGNCINFAVRVLQASNATSPGDEPNNGTVRGIAIAVAVFACFIHAFSRRGGILLNNFLALIKICILLFIVATTIAVAAGGLPKTPNVISANTNADRSFSSATGEANGYASAFLAVVFAFSGFEQPNYVLGEIRNPRRKFPIAMCASVSFVCVLYMTVNICYMVVVPQDLQITENVAQVFFERTFGRLSGGNDNTAERVFNAFLAISSFGNIVVMTYTAARVKQEIAKEGILPLPKFFAQNVDFSVGRLIKWAQKHVSHGTLHRMLKKRWLSPEEHSEKTPVGALVLHFLSCIVLIFATYGLTPDNAYTLLTGLLAYVLNGCFGVLLSVGILFLRFNKSQNWRDKTRPFNHYLSILAATVYLIGNLFPVIVTWIPPTNSSSTSGTNFASAAADAPDTQPSSQTVAWYVLPTISWAVLFAGALWFLGFLAFAKRKEKRERVVFTVQKVPFFERDPPLTGRPFQDHETVYLAWAGEGDFKDGSVHDDFGGSPPLDFGEDVGRMHDFGGRDDWAPRPGPGPHPDFPDTDGW